MKGRKIRRKALALCVEYVHFRPLFYLYDGCYDGCHCNVTVESEPCVYYDRAVVSSGLSLLLQMKRKCTCYICVSIKHFYFPEDYMVIHTYVYICERMRKLSFFVLSSGLLYILPLLGEEGCLEEGTIQCIFSVWKD